MIPLIKQLSFIIRPMLILTSRLALFLLCYQYYCNVVYIFIIYV